MPTAENAILYYESGQSAVAMAALSDDGDCISFNSADELWSKRSGYEPDVKPNGLATGGLVSAAASGSNDVVDVAALTCFLAGTLASVSADTDVSITRATPSDTHIINSITINSSGAIAVVAGTDGTAFSETRGAAGGPPWIPTGSIEIAQVRLSSSSAAAVSDDEIFKVVNTHCERYDQPTWQVKPVRVENQILGDAGIDFDSALPQIHSDDAGSTVAGKKVYAAYYEPLFAQVPKAADFVRPANSKSVSSKQYYGTTSGAVSTSLGQGSFNMEAQDGVTDGLLKLEGEQLWFKFKPNRLQSPYILAQGYLGITESFPAGDNISAACTISAESQGVRVAS